MDEENSRVAEQANRSCRTGVMISHPPLSAVSEHAECWDQPVNVDNFEILNSTQSVVDLCILESLYLFKHSPKLNYTQTCCHYSNSIFLMIFSPANFSLALFFIFFYNMHFALCFEFAKL